MKAKSGLLIAHIVCQAFKTISADNELIYKKHHSDVDLNQYKLKGIDAIIASPAECQNFIALPAKNY